MDDEPDYLYDEDKLGMTVSSASVTLAKDENNLIGISIGGGSPVCPCVYIVQIFDGTPAAADGSLEPGDEILRVSRQPVKGKSRTEVARMIQGCKDSVTIVYNKLHASPKQGKTLDIVLKKVKHKVVEHMSSETADALGLSRAILCNDSLVKKLEELEQNAQMCKTLMQHISALLKSHVGLVQTFREFGDIFVEIGNHEPQISSGEVFLKFGDAHRNMEKHGIQLMKVLRPMLGDLHTFLYKAVPDTRLTIKKYLDAKFEYLSYCLKIKEMDDEEAQCTAMQEALYRVETGNYEYRLILRCRQEARKTFSKLRSDVLVKLELLDQKRVRDISYQLQLFVNAIAKFHTDCKCVLQPTRNLFPIEVDISQVGYKYNTTGQLVPDGEEEEEGAPEAAVEAEKEGDSELLNLSDSDFSVPSLDPVPIGRQSSGVGDSGSDGGTADGDVKLLDI